MLMLRIDSPPIQIAGVGGGSVAALDFPRAGTS
jgi:hypothetical protein